MKQIYWIFIKKNDRREVQRNPKPLLCILISLHYLRLQNFQATILPTIIQNTHAAFLYNNFLMVYGLRAVHEAVPERRTKIESQQEPSKLPATSAKSWRWRVISRHGSSPSSYEKRVWHEIFPRVIRLRRVSVCNSVGKWAVVGLHGDIRIPCSESIHAEVA